MPRRTNTRQRLVEAAAQLFWRQGYAQTGVNEIISAAGTTSGSFYHFFPAKDDLLLAVVDGVSELLDRELAAAVERTDDPVERIFAVLDASRSHLERHDFALGSPLGSLAAEVATSHPQVRQRIAAVFERWTEHVEGLLEAAREGLPAELDRRALARFILAAVEGAMLQSRLSRSLAPFDDTVAALRRHLEALRVGDRPARRAVRLEPPSAPRTRRPAADWRAW